MLRKTAVITTLALGLSLVGYADASSSVAAPLFHTTTTTTTTACTHTAAVVVIPLTAAKHSGVINHAKAAIKLRHYPRVMVLNRPGAAARRTALLKNIPTKTGYDRDEYPAAVGRKVVKADVAYVNSTQNRSAGAVMGNKLRPYCDGTKYIYAGT